MTDAELKGVCAQALNMAKRDMERKQFVFLLASYHESQTPPLHRMRRVEKTIIANLGEEWLNSEATKEAGFRTLRLACHFLPPDAVVFVTAANQFIPTPKLDELPAARQDALLNGSHAVHHRAVREGYFTLVDILAAIAQTPDRVCHYTQEVDERGQAVGHPKASFAPQADFSGRMKMY